MSDSRVENKAVVNIFGEDYPITGYSDQRHIRRVADFVDAKMREAARGLRTVGRDRVAILAAMSIASELFDARIQMDELKQQVDATADSLLEQLDKAAT